MMNRWFRSTVRPSPTMTAEEEDQRLQVAEHALLQLLNDNIAEADRILKTDNSSYHYLGRGISGFVAAMLGAEKEVLKHAATLLQEAENKSWDDTKKAQRDSTAFRSKIYAPGSEYLLCYCISQLTNAICHVLSGSVTEAIRGLYKLRKAYLTLDGMMEEEKRYFKGQMASRRNSLTPAVATAKQTVVSEPLHQAPTRASTAKSNDKVDAEVDDKVANLSPSSTRLLAPAVTRTQSRLLDIDPASVGITSHTDIFIHSGTRLCYGMLLILFSMIENPLFSKVLYIVGFKGDRERGTRCLWQAARFDNFNSAIAGIVLLGYYNGLVGFCDILPTDSAAKDDLAGYPKDRCETLLSDMRKRHPTSKLWKLEEARMNAYNKDLGASVKILADNSDSSMKQIAMINMFEMSLTAMFYHDYELMAKCWIQCAELSAWSPTLYAFMTGAAFLELYRDSKDKRPTEAKDYKEKATKYFRKGPPLAGRQTVMSKQLPFDLYVCRKVQKWEERASTWGTDLVDAIGVSPLSEMIFLWNGCKKQATEQLQQSLDILRWSRTSHPEKFDHDLDEQAIHALLTACIWRNMGKYSDSRSLLEKEILSHERSEFRGHLKDDWSHPCAHYEMACISWNEKDVDGQDHKSKVLDCEDWLEKAQKWPDQYVMDTRLSIKLTTSFVTIKRHKTIMGF